MQPELIIMPSVYKLMNYRVLNIILLFAALSLLFACAEIEEKERLLSAAGFSMKYADTPEKLDHLKLQEQHELIPFIKDEKTYFVYADSSNCHCMFVGDETAYQQFNKLQIEHEIADEQRLTAEINREWELDSRQWDPWGNGPWNGIYDNGYK